MKKEPLKTAYIETLSARCSSCGAPWNPLEPRCQYCGVVQIIMPKDAELMTWLYRQERIEPRHVADLGRPGRAIPVLLFGDEKISDVIQAVPCGYSERERRHYMAVAKLTRPN